MATNDQDYRTGMAVGRITQLTETEQLGIAMGGPAGAAMVMASKYDKELEELRWQLRIIREHYGEESINALLSQKRSSPLNNPEQP